MVYYIVKAQQEMRKMYKNYFYIISNTKTPLYVLKSVNCVKKHCEREIPFNK